MMQEIKDQPPKVPKKPLFFYYIIALIVVMLLNALLFPSMLSEQVTPGQLRPVPVHGGRGTGQPGGLGDRGRTAGVYCKKGGWAGRLLQDRRLAGHGGMAAGKAQQHSRHPV